MLDPDILIYGINSEGVLFELSFAVIIAHELSHWRNRTADVREITNAAMKSQSYDYVGDTVRDEWVISTELGITDRRATYQATIMPQDHRFSYFDLNNGPVSDTVNIVRLGNVDEDNQGRAIVNDVINYAGRYESTLTFAFSGDDIVNGSARTDWVYGGEGRDILRGADGEDILYGEVDDDVIEGGQGSDAISGGDGRDILRGGTGSDFISGDAGNDLIDTGIASSSVIYGMPSDMVFAGDGDDIIISSWGTVYGESGADQFWIRSGFTAIQDSSPDDRIF